jgi:hypothetical protein
MPRDHSKDHLWANRFERFRHSGLTISEFCRNEQIAVRHSTKGEHDLRLTRPGLPHRRHRLMHHFPGGVA